MPVFTSPTTDSFSPEGQSASITCDHRSLRVSRLLVSNVTCLLASEEILSFLKAHSRCQHTQFLPLTLYPLEDTAPPAHATVTPGNLPRNACDASEQKSTSKILVELLPLLLQSHRPILFCFCTRVTHNSRSTSIFITLLPVL